MRERPILFSGPMVRAILDGRKTQTRRIVKDLNPTFIESRPTAEQVKNAMRCPYGVPGDRLWVREKWQWARQQYCTCPQPSEASPCDDWVEGTGCKSNRVGVVYAADCAADYVGRWRPSIHMPRWASRITLKIVGVRVQRVQEISEVDAKAEGLEFMEPNRFAPPGGKYWMPHYAAFQSLWDFVNGPGAWERNDWVWAMTLKRINP